MQDPARFSEILFHRPTMEFERILKQITHMGIIRDVEIPTVPYHPD